MNQIQSILQESISVKTSLLNDDQLIAAIDQSVSVITTALKQDHKIWFCGNGGSAADAQHLAAELSGRFYFDRDPLFAEALHVNTSYLTAVANDYGYDVVYSRLMKAKCRVGDVLVAISTSGNSVNIINAMLEAKAKGALVIAMTGATGGAMKEHADILLNMPSTDTPRIQECHIVVGHIICQLVEAAYFQAH